MSGHRQSRMRHVAAMPQPRGTPARVAPGCCVQRALGAARAELARDAAAVPGLSDLAAAAGVSPRTLQRRFAQVLGRSPHSVLQDLRLAAARQTLRTGEASSVLEVALRHGFEHPGRFAIAYAHAFEEPPSATLRAARLGRPTAKMGSSATPVVLHALLPDTPANAARARRATDDLAIALGRAPGWVLLSSEPCASARPRALLRLQGRVEADGVVLSLVRCVPGVVVATIRESFRRRAGIDWADRAIGVLRAAVAAEEAERARRTSPHRASVEALIARARPAALSQEPGMVGMALDLLAEALVRDPAHPRALALAGWSRALGANHLFTRDLEGERARAVADCGRALALAPDIPEVLTLVAGALSLTRQLDDAAELVARSLALDPCQPEALRRLGFIHNFRGDGRRAVSAFRRALSLYPAGHDGTISLIGLGIAKFILGDYARSARALARALDQQPARAWPHRFLTAAAMHAGAHEESLRSLASLRRSFPDLTVEWCARSVALHPEAKERFLDGLARAGLPR